MTRGVTVKLNVGSGSGVMMGALVLGETTIGTVVGLGVVRLTGGANATGVSFGVVALSDGDNVSDGNADGVVDGGSDAFTITVGGVATDCGAVELLAVGWDVFTLAGAAGSGAAVGWDEFTITAGVAFDGGSVPGLVRTGLGTIINEWMDQGDASGGRQCRGERMQIPRRKTATIVEGTCKEGQMEARG